MNASVLATPELIRCVHAATLAPSLHNSQPWRFRLTSDAVEGYAGRDRQLDVLDPDGRELMVSVGAAVFTLRLALRHAGRMPELAVRPDPDRPDLVAVIRPGRPAEPSAAVHELADAIARRHTNRQPFLPKVVPADVIDELAAPPRRARRHTNRQLFLPKVVPADVIDELRAAAGHEGAALTVAGPASRTIIAGLGREAERRLRARGGYRAEMDKWTRPAARRR